MAPHGVQGHDVVVDLFSHFGSSRHEDGYDALMRILGRDQIVAEYGDILCL
jgi:hypothetical protein